ncbi:hypothetical protein ScPMuIL_017620 [Solemya velum]
MTATIVKAGWLQRQSTVLHRWKRSWFVLYQTGDLVYFESQDSLQWEERFVARIIHSIKTAAECCVSAPEGFGKDCLLTIVFPDKELQLCAESHDDMRAWQIALEEARIIPSHSAPMPPVMAPAQSTVVHSLSYPYATMPPVNLTSNHPGTVSVLRNGYPSYPAYPTYNPGYSYPGQVIHRNPDGTQVVYVNQPQYRRRRYDGTDMAVGVMAGAAVGSMMWGPMLWW